MSKEHVAKLIEKAAQTGDANDALKFSQSAVNVANAICALKQAEPNKKD